MKKRKYYTFSQLKKLMPKVIIKQFEYRKIKDKETGIEATCCIKGCKEKINWWVGRKDGIAVGLCFEHGEDL